MLILCILSTFCVKSYLFCPSNVFTLFERSAKTITALLLLLCSALPRRLCVRCECSHLLTWALKKIRSADACGVKPA